MTSSADTRYQDFLASLENDNHVIILQMQDGIACYESNTYIKKDDQQPITVIPVWSANYKIQAEANIAEEWSGYETIELPIDVFLTEMLPYLARECVFIAINLEPTKNDIEKDPIEIFKDLGLIEDEDFYIADNDD